MDHSIREVQQRLHDLGFDPGPIDGLRGPRTDAAITAFKASIGFRARPYLGPLTRAALFDDATVQDDSGIPWFNEGRRIMGLHEARNTSALSEWFDRSVSWIDPREIPWCGAFVATCYRKWKPDIALPENPLGARNWGKFGESCDPQLGACLVFWRGSRSGWKGHAGFYAGEDDDAFHVLGGNQSNAVTITRVSRYRLLDARWPEGWWSKPGKRVWLTPGGAPLSVNEA